MWPPERSERIEGSLRQRSKFAALITPTLEIVNDHPLALLAFPRPVVDADFGHRHRRRPAVAANDPEQRIVVDRYHEAAREPPAMAARRAFQAGGDLRSLCDPSSRLAPDGASALRHCRRGSRVKNRAQSTQGAPSRAVPLSVEDDDAAATKLSYTAEISICAERGDASLS